MTAPVAVDVLGLLRLIADGEGDTEVMAMRVHAAVTNLIKAGNAFAIAEAELRPSSKGYYDAREHFLAALAGVGGAR